MKTFLRSDPLTATSHIWHDQPDGSQVLESIQDVQDIVDCARAAYNATDERARWGGFQTRVAHIPLTIYLDLFRRGITDDQEAFRDWLNDPDNRYFRTRPGRV